MKFHNILPAFAVLLSSIIVAQAAGQPKNSVLLRNIKSLTLYKDRMTTHRRVSAIPQLKCVGGSGKGHYEVDVMRCMNSGSSYDEDNVDWTCKTSLPPEFKLGSTDVICEGYSSPDDPYILKGSCGVEYRLILTELGEEKYGRKGWFGHKPPKSQSSYKTQSADDEPISEKFFNFIFWCLFVSVGLWIGFKFLMSLFGDESGNRRRQGGGRHPGGGGWGGGGDGNDPPPPYDPRPPRQTYSKPQSTSRTSSSSQSSEPWRPGFWSGAAAGAAAAYAATNRANRNREAQAQQEQSWFQRGWDANTGNMNANTGSSWFNVRGNDAGEGPSGTTRSYGSNTSSEPPSSSRYESTGFGSTRRR